MILTAAVHCGMGFKSVLMGFRVLDGDSLTIDGAVIRFVPAGQTDTDLSSVAHVPDSATVVAGDVAYNGVHMWMYQSTPHSRASWLHALDIVESLSP